MKKVFFTLLFSVLQLAVFAQQSEVPSEIAFAGMRLKLSSYVRRALASDMEMIRRNEKYFQLKVEKANIYFPIVEKVFKEEGFPEDFKYLALQESSFVPDAVSSSNAVGYWQFKKESAQEVGIRINSEVDERMNIVASSKGAAAYLKKNNNTLNNWVYALLSYNLGLGGVKSYVKDKYRGASEMDIDKDMHWYVIRFLAHKLAYENAVGKNSNPSLTLLEYTDGNGKSLSEIATLTTVDANLLEEYNKWVLGKKIPTDKTYVAILPVKPGDQQKVAALAQTPGGEDKNNSVSSNSNNSVSVKIKGSRKERPSGLGAGEIALVTQVNKIKAIQARDGDNISTLAIRTGLTPDAIMRFNDIRSFDPVIPKKFYYLQLKRNNALVRTHVVKEGETLWEISQDYGVRMKAIRKKNRMAKDEKLQVGRVLCMRGKRRPKNVPIEIVPVPKTEQLALPVQKEVQVIPVVNYTAAKSNDADTSASVHTVSKGETLYAISRTYAVPLDSLKAWNDIPVTGIKEGGSLYLKNPAAIEAKNNLVHVVNPKETIYKIAKEYNVTVQQLKDWNNKKDDSLNIGEKLYIRPTP